MESLSDFLTRIRNGYQARKDTVVASYSRQKETIAKILVAEGFVEKSLKTDAGLTLTLKYFGKRPAVKGVKQISKPGLRIYEKSDKIPLVKVGKGITIISTNQGVMTNKDAHKKNLGGEVICQIW